MNTKWLWLALGVALLLAPMGRSIAVAGDADVKTMERRLAELQKQAAKLEGEIRLLQDKLAQARGYAGPPAQQAPPLPTDPTARMLAEQLKSLAQATAEAKMKPWAFAIDLDKGVFEFDHKWYSRSRHSLESARAMLAKERTALERFLASGKKSVNLTSMDKGAEALLRRVRASLAAMPTASIVVIGEGGRWKAVEAEQAQEALWYALADVVEAQLGLRAAQQGEAAWFQIELKFTLGEAGKGKLPKLTLSYTLTLRDLAKEKQVLLERKLAAGVFEPRPGEVPAGMPDLDLFLQAFDGHELFDLRPVPPELQRLKAGGPPRPL